MRMKFVLLGVFSLLFSVSIHAIEKQIVLHSHCLEFEDQWTKDYRSLEIIPTATHDRNQVSIYSEKELEGVLIRVTDSLGSVLFEQELNSLIGQYTFQLPASGNGFLTLDIITSTEQYEGDFSLK